jgi:hypothetical protein
MKNFKFLKDVNEADEAHVLHGEHLAGQEIELEEDAAAPFLEDGTLELVEEGAAAASSEGSEGGDNSAE